MEKTMQSIEISDVITPAIPPMPEYVAGVERGVILLNNREGMSQPGESEKYHWEFHPEPIEGVPAPDAPEQSHSFSDMEEGWKQVIVPGELEMQGFELQNNTEYYYRLKVRIPEDFTGHKCMLRFDGVYGNARVWVDDKYVRSHVGGFTTWYCDITPYAVPGEKLCLTVGIADLQGDHPGLYNNGEQLPLRDPSGASDYAHHNIGGILRDVTLLALPCTYLERLHTNVEFDEDFVDAKLQIGIRINSEKNRVSVKYALLDQKGSVCLEQEADPDCEITVLNIKCPRKWDAEHPCLYTLRVTLLEEGRIEAVYQEKIGFREIGFAGKKGGRRNKIYVNGQEVKLRGTCRHDVSFQFGRSTTPEEDWAEVRAYKEANINHVRTSHYPVSRYFLEACDALGMYVEEENAASFQGDNGYTIYCAPEDFLGEFTEMIERDRNHPSILIWSLANESGFECSEGFRRECDYVRSVDRSRPVIFSYPFTVHSLPLPYDILSMHYVDAEAPMGLDDIPVLHDEYMHISCYNMEELRRDPNVRNFWGRSIQKAWDRIFETDGALGGDLWGGIDDIFYLPENIREKWQSHSKGCAAGYGAWGSVLDVYRRWKPEGYLTKKAYSPVKIEEKSAIFHEGRVLIPVKNRFDHTNLRELTVEYEYLLDCPGAVRRDPEHFTSMTGESVCNDTGCQGDSMHTERVREAVRADVPPHSEGMLEFECSEIEKVQSLHLWFYKDEILVDEYLIENKSKKDGNNLAAGKRGRKKDTETAINIEETDREIRISADSSTFVFDRESAQLTKGVYKGRTLLQGGPQLLLTGVPMEQWKKTEPGIQAAVEEGCAVVTLTGTYANGFEVWYTVTIYEDGSFGTRYLIQGGWTDKTIKELGVSYELAPGAEKISWQREGQYSCYPENHIGRNYGTAYRRNTGMDALNSSAGTDFYYRSVPAWDWKDDMWDDFYYSREEADNGLMTRDFRALRENIRLYQVHFADQAEYVRVEDENAQTAARVSVSVSGEGEERTFLLVANRWNYPDLGWGNDGKRGIYVGRGTYGGVMLRFGDDR